MRTAKDLGSMQANTNHALIGLITEVGELFDWYKKGVVYGKGLDDVNLVEEVGDCFWYIGLLLHTVAPGQDYDKLILAAEDILSKGPSPKDVTKEEALEALYALHILVTQITGRAPNMVVQPHEVLQGVASLLLFFLYWKNTTLSTCLTKNIDKLASRYGDKYTDYAALHRDTTAERKILES